MTLVSTEKTDRSSVPALIGGAGFAVAAAVMLYGFSIAVIDGPKMRSAYESQIAREIATEDRAFCEKFGMSMGTTLYLTCVSELMQIRRLHEERLSREFSLL
jgi:hypothetical protein